MPVLERFIPNFLGEVAELNKLCNAGFIMGFGISSRKNPDYVVNTFPSEWSAIYEDADYMFFDPIVQWLMTHSGMIRWSEIKFPDIRKVRRLAATHGLKYGCVISMKTNKTRCFLSMSRKDREFYEFEMSAYQNKFRAWCDAVVFERPYLKQSEIDVLRLLRAGMNQAQIADALGISLPTVRQRQGTAMAKLGAKTSHAAVGLACTYRMLDDLPQVETMLPRLRDTYQF